MQIRIVVAVVFATTVVCAGTAFGGPQSARLGSAPKLIHAGHDNIVVDPALRRFAGMVTGLGNPDAEIGSPGSDRANAGRINSTAYSNADPQRNFQFAVKFQF